MRTSTDHAPGLDSTAALSGILALLVADREAREGRGSRRTERILLRTGLSDDQIAAITGQDAVGEQSVIDRARMALTHGSPTTE